MVISSCDLQITRRKNHARDTLQRYVQTRVGALLVLPASEKREKRRRRCQQRRAASLTRTTVRPSPSISSLSLSRTER